MRILIMSRYIQRISQMEQMQVSRYIGIWFIAIIIGMTACSTMNDPNLPANPGMGAGDDKVEGVDYYLPHIDLNHWKVTLPIGSPTEVSPPEILNYASSDLLKPFMYNDSIDGSLVFHTYPGQTTANTSYSRTELREQMKPGNNNVNWTFAQGGKMKGKLRLKDITKDKDGKYHRTIIMQIHGRLTNAQRDLIGQKDNNAAPVLKIYWTNNKIRVVRKVLKNRNASDEEILKVDAWTDEGFYFEREVGFQKFNLEVIASDGRLEVILDGWERMVFEDTNMKRWGIFENYFKAGNYLSTKDEGAYATVKYYELDVTH